jgi:hypothetical protein
LIVLVIAAIVLAAFALAPEAFANVRGAWRLRHIMTVASYYGNDHQCNICGRNLRRFRFEKITKVTDECWRARGLEPAEAECPFCASRPRHRTAFIYLKQQTDLFDGKPKRMLHIAPEPSLGPVFQAIPNIDYISGDLDPTKAMVQMDITDIHFPDNSFDVIYCSHVLEHVPDDRKAMRELARVLKPTGWAMLAVPIFSDKTFEDPSIKTAADRERVYGQWDHVRMYGSDFVDRLRESGFDVTVDRFVTGLSEDMVRRHELSREEIYLCRKRTATPVSATLK